MKYTSHELTPQANLKKNLKTKHVELQVQFHLFPYDLYSQGFYGILGGDWITVHGEVFV